MPAQAIHSKNPRRSIPSLFEFSLILRDKTGRIRSLNRKTVKVELTDPLAAHRELLDELTDADIHNLLAYLETL